MKFIDKYYEEDKFRLKPYGNGVRMSLYLRRRNDYE